MMYVSCMKIITLFFLFIFSKAVFSLETDQFIAADIVLKDSSSVMNDYFQKSIEKALAQSNKKNQSCQDVALNVMETATGKYSISKASSFAAATSLIERYPEDCVSERGYIRQSFYQHAWLPLQVVDLARTINVNGIYIGTDKFGHFTRMGMNYYKQFLKLTKKGTLIDEAIRKSIINGFGSEYGILGYGIDGVLSFGDLAANYQGLMFALDMCRGQNPILIKEKGLWIENPKHLFDVKDYIIPQMDESFNFSFWRKPLYKRVAPKLIAEYCQAYKSSLFQERIAHYKEILKPNLNDKLIQEVILSQAKFDRKKEDLYKLCQ